MKYIYILGLILLILICILYNHKIIEGVSLTVEEIEKIEVGKEEVLDASATYGDDFMGDVDISSEKLPTEYHIKERKCNEVSICEQLKLPEYEDCGYCLADEFDLSIPFSFHYGHKGGTYTSNTNCYANQPDYTNTDGYKKRNVEWVAPSKYSPPGNTGLAFDKCKEIKTKFICEKQKQCNFMTGMEENIDKEANCGWCFDKESDVGGNPYVRNLSTEPNDLKDIEANYMVRNTTNELKKHYYCSNNTERKKGEIEKIELGKNFGSKCKNSQIEKEEWKTIQFPDFEAKHGKCGKDLIKHSDCSIFLKESCMKNIYNKDTDKMEKGPFHTDKDECIKDLWVDIGFVEDNFEDFKNGIYETEEGERIENDQIIKGKMQEWRAANNFGKIQKSMIDLAKEKIHSRDFYTAKKWNKILLGKNVCNDAFDTSVEISPNQNINCVNPCYQYQLDGTEWEDTPKECQVKIFKKMEGGENGLVHPGRKIPSVLQFFQASNLNEGFTIRDISKVSVIKDLDNENNIISLDNVSLKDYPINKISSIYKKIKGKKKSLNFEEKYKAHLQFDGRPPDEMSEKLCWIEFVKIMRTYPGTKLENRLLHIIINDEMKQKVESKKSLNSMSLACNVDKTFNGKKINCFDTSQNKIYKDNSIVAYLSIVQGNTNNWKLEKRTYEDPGFDFRPWNIVVNDYWKDGNNWNKFMYLMMKQDHVKLHICNNCRDSENKQKIEIGEKSPFYNLINSCTYSKNMFLLQFEVKGSDATLYIKSDNHQQEKVLSNGKNEILLHPNLYGKSIELIPLVKNKLNINNVKLIRIRDKKYIHKLPDYNKKSKCDNVWNYCYWRVNGQSLIKLENQTNITSKESESKVKYLLKRHREQIDFVKFFALMSDEDFYDLEYYKDTNDIEIPRSKEGDGSIYNIINNKAHNKIIRRNPGTVTERKDTNFILDINAQDQNWGLRTSRIDVLKNDVVQASIGIGGEYNVNKGSGKLYNTKNGRVSNNKTEIIYDVTNNMVNQKSNNSKASMKLKHVTSQNGGNSTYIDSAELKILNPPGGIDRSIDLLSGISGQNIKIVGDEQKKRGLNKELDWVSFKGNETPIFHKNFSYELTGKGKDQGWGYSTSSIYGSKMEQKHGESVQFGHVYKDFTINGDINEHNTDHKIKIHQFTSQNGGHETYIKDLKLKINDNGGRYLEDIQISGNLAKKVRQPPVTTIYEGFENKSSDILQNNVYNIINNIKNYFFPTREPFLWLPLQPPASSPPNPITDAIDKAVVYINLEKIRKDMTNKKAMFTFIGRDQGWGNNGGGRASINGVYSEVFGHKWKAYKIDFSDKINTKNLSWEARIHKHGYPGMEVHIEGGRIDIKNPSDINTQRSTYSYDVGNYSVKDRSDGKIISTQGKWNE